MPHGLARVGSVAHALAMRPVTAGRACRCLLWPALRARRISMPTASPQDVRVLSGDDSRGAPRPRAGEQKTVDYLVQRCPPRAFRRAATCSRMARRAWTQDLPLVRSRSPGRCRCRCTAGAMRCKWTQGERSGAACRRRPAATRWISTACRWCSSATACTAPERDWDDFKGVDLKGKIALMLVNDPDFETGSGDFGGKAMTYYGRWTYKYEELARRGAAGALVIHETEPASYGWETVKNSNTGPVFDVLRDDAAAPCMCRWKAGSSVMRPRSAAEGGPGFRGAEGHGAHARVHPGDAQGVTLSVDLQGAARAGESRRSRSPCCRARNHPDEWVLYTAHWDHLGSASRRGRWRFDLQRRGGQRRGSWRSCWRSRAHSARTGRAERSVGFLFVGAEEQGLLGSEYYARESPVSAGEDRGRPQHRFPAADIAGKGFLDPRRCAVALMDPDRRWAGSSGAAITPDSRPQAGCSSAPIISPSPSAACRRFRSSPATTCAMAHRARARPGWRRTARSDTTSPATRSAKTGDPMASPRMRCCYTRWAEAGRFPRMA